MLATVLITTVLVLIVGAILGSAVKRKKRGESLVGCSECGGSCGGCAMHGMCHGGADAAIRKT